MAATKKPTPPPEEPTADQKAAGDKKAKAENDANVRNATGGQTATAPVEPDTKTISREELAASPQPKAPEHPLEDIQDTIEGTQPPEETK